MAQMILNPGVPEDLTGDEFAGWLNRWHAAHNTPEAQAQRAQALQPEPETAYRQETGYRLTAAGAAYLAAPGDDEGGETRPEETTDYLILA